MPEIVSQAHWILNKVVHLVEAVSRDADGLANQVEKRTGTQPTEFRLGVIEFGDIIVLRDKATGIEFMGDGQSGAYQFVFPPVVG